MVSGYIKRHGALLPASADQQRKRKMKFASSWLLLGVWACVLCLALARPQTERQSFVDTIAAPFNTVAGVTTNTVNRVVDSASNFFSDTGDRLSRFTSSLMSSGQDTFKGLMDMINRRIPNTYGSG